jgi:hypothetical protein
MLGLFLCTILQIIRNALLQFYTMDAGKMRITQMHPKKK